MARSGKVAIPPKEPTEITNDDVAGAITFQNLSASPIRVIGSLTGVVPTEADFDGGLIYGGSQGESGMTLGDLFPGTGFVRLWAVSGSGATLAVYHA